MEYKLGDDLPVGIYCSNDNVKYLKIKVTVKKVTPSCLSNSEVFSKQDNSGELELQPLTTGEYSAFSVERIFSWQEKVFSQASDVDEPAKQDVLMRQRCQAVLFSYVDTDMSIEEWQRRRPVTYPPSYGYLERKMSVKYRGKNVIPQKRPLMKTPFSERMPVIHVRSKQSSSHQLQSVGQFMSIMVVFNPFDSMDKAEEREVCFLHMDPAGCLTILPDFNVNGVPYIIQNSRSETFEYFIECVSRDIQSLEAETEKKIVRKLNLQRIDALTSLVGTTFERSSNSLKFFMNGEIASSSGFSCDNLYIQYYFELPEGWSEIHEEFLSGSTYTCKSKYSAEDKVAYFGFPLCLELETNSEISINEDCGLPAIHLFVEVISLDRWNNGRGEGYGYTTIPLYPGNYSVCINTWKILPTSLIQRLRHFFIGGTSYLDDISCVRIPNSMKDPQLSKYGIKTETSGSVNLKYHAALQIGSEVRRERYDIYLAALKKET